MSLASELLNSSFEKLRSSLDEGHVTSLELTSEALRRAVESQSKINSFITISDTQALSEAAAADARLKGGERNALLGIPIAIKDLILCKDQKATAASKILKDFVAPYDATVSARVKAAGAPIIGKTNLDEFAMGSSNETSFFGAVKNPWDLSRVAGGSSGGSAAVVAARIAPLSLGTDTGGSIRQPSALCGITGLKPTYGRVSRYGVVAFASSLDQVGPMCSDALGCAALLEQISGHDEHDATSSSQQVPKFVEECKSFRETGNLRGLRLGVPREFLTEGLDSQVEQGIVEMLETCKDLGAELVEISLPHTRFSLPVYYLVCTSEASSNLARYDGIHYGYRSEQSSGNLEDVYSRSRGEGFGVEVRLRILLGTFALSSGYYDAYYRKASQVRSLIKKDFIEAFGKCDFIVGPTSPTTAFRLNEKLNDPLSMYLADIYTLSTNLAGLPGLSMNAGFDDRKLPIGFQMIAPWWQESKLLGMAALLEKHRNETTPISPLAREYGELRS